MANAPSVRFGDGVVQQATGVGTIFLASEWLTAPIVLTNVLYIPDCPVNLLSVHATAKSEDCVISFSEHTCVANKGTKTLWTVPASIGGVYHFLAHGCTVPALATVIVEPSAAPPLSLVGLWHRRFGHPGQTAMQELINGGLVEGLPSISHKQLQRFALDPCDACCVGKATKESFPERRRVTHAPLELIHIDLQGPFCIGIRMEVYLLVAVDDHSGWNAVVPMRLKSESAGWIIAIIRNWMGLLLGVAFRCLRTDQAKEFLVPELTNWLASVQAKHEVSSVYCPQQNGVAERFNGVVASMARTMLIESEMSKGFWTYAFTCASYLRNRLPSKRGATPYERFFGQVPDVSLLRVFGTRCYVKLLDGKTRSKTDERAIRGRLVGYSSMSKAYQIWIPEQHKVVVARDVVFFEGSGPGPVLGQVPYDGSPFSEASSPAVIGEGPPVVVGIEHDAAHLVNGPDAGFHMNLRSRKSAEPIDAGVPAVCGGTVLGSSDRVNFNSLGAPPPALGTHLQVGLGGDGDNVRHVETPGLRPGALQPEVPPRASPENSSSRSISLAGNVEGSAGVSDFDSPMSTLVPGWMGASGVGDAMSPLPPPGGGSIASLPPNLLQADSTSIVTPLPDGRRAPSRRMLGATPEFGTLSAERAATLAAAQVRYPPELPPAPILDPIPLSPSLGVEEPEPADAFISEPINLTYKRAVALDNPDREHWLLAMRDEMASLEGHQTWTLTPLPRGCKTITGRWLFTIKNGVDGQPERYKARFVARGFLQREGIDYDLTFAPVTSKTTLRVFLAGMVHRKMFPRQLDIKTAFLNATLEEGLDLYLAQPEGFEVGKGLVCKIIKSLYGLKQAPRLWSAEVCRVLRLCGFRPTASDPALFVRLEADGNWSWVTTYVDDFWLALDELFLYIAIIEIMRQEGWTVTEMGVPRMFLSLDCDLSLDAEGRCDKIVISQRTAIQGMLERFRIGKGEATRATVAVPMVSGAVTTQAEGSRVLPNNRLYSSLIGCFIYLSTCTRPDIAYAVSCLSRFTSCPTQAHWHAAIRVLVYLRTHPRLGIGYSHAPDFCFKAYSDASFGEDLAGRRSQTGLAVLASGGVVSWVSKRQITPALSTGEAEYQALAAAAREVQWLKHLRADLGLPCKLVTIRCDASVSLSWCADYKHEPRAKHIDIIHHYVKDLVLSKRLGTVKVHTSLQVADTFTKPLTADVFWSMNGMLGLVDVKELKPPSK